MKWLSLSGWATEKSSLAHLLPGNSEIEEIDFNFFNNVEFPEDREIENHITEEPYSIICFSMGTLKALQLSTIRKPEIIVAIGGFKNFCGSGKEAKLRNLQVLQMIKGIRKAPEKTLSNFAEQAQLKIPFNNHFNQNNLIKGLELLKDCDMSQAVENLEIDILSIYGEQDKIVPKHIAEQLMSGEGNRKMVTINGGHGIIQSQAETIKELIRNY